MTWVRTDLRQMTEFTEMMGAMCDYTTAEVFIQIDSAVADCGAGELDDFIFRRTSFPPHELSAGRDGNYTEEYSTVWGFPHIDSAHIKPKHVDKMSINHACDHIKVAKVYSPVLIVCRKFASGVPYFFLMETCCDIIIIYR